MTLTVQASFAPVAVLLTSGTSYTVPAGASTMKAWAVGPGSNAGNVGGAGGCAYKTWSVSGGQSVSYAVGAVGASDTSVVFGGTTISGLRASGTTGSPLAGAGGGYSGGDGGANGGNGYASADFTLRFGGAVGGNTATTYRYAMTDVSGLKAALALAGAKTSEDNTGSPAFGSGAYSNKFGTRLIGSGVGGGGMISGWTTQNPGGGAVVLYFT
ncbi:MAG: hypothetical protein EBR82_53490 [Caulobacteraceae bacterium]|nr:hypothetical protein [Caulobacteraceae bacterium]